MTALLIVCIVLAGLGMLIDLAGFYVSDKSDEQAVCLLNLFFLVPAIVAMSIALGVL